MIKLYTAAEYISMSQTAQKINQMLYVYTYSVTAPEEEPDRKTIEYAILRIAPTGFYICYKDNYTDGTINEHFEEEKKAAQRRKLDALSLTAADVERAIYKDKGLNFTDILNAAEDIPDIDIRELEIELKANRFLRNHPYIDKIASMLGYTVDDIDYLFEHKQFKPQKEEI